MSRRRPQQQSFRWKSRGGARRKPRPENVGLQPHVARPEFDHRLPVHVTMRAVRGVPSMRTQTVQKAVLTELSRASEKGFRLLHYSVQDDHLHSIAEADDAAALSRGMQRLASRIAMAVNALVGRRGRFWRERYHRRDLRKPRQYRNALVYVLFNIRKHTRGAERARWTRSFDALSSAIWLDEWSDDDIREKVRAARAGPPPIAAPKTWMAIKLWKKHGLLDPCESPVSPG